MPSKKKSPKNSHKTTNKRKPKNSKDKKITDKKTEFERSKIEEVLKKAEQDKDNLNDENTKTEKEDTKDPTRPIYKNYYKTIIRFLLISFVIGIITSLIVTYILFFNQRAFFGMQYEGQTLFTKPFDEIREMVSNDVETLNQTPITFTYQDTQMENELSYSTTLEELGFGQNADRLMDKITTAGRDGYIFGIDKQIELIFSPQDFSPKIALTDKTLFENFTEILHADIDQPAIEPSFTFIDGAFTYIDGFEGYIIDDDTLISSIINGVKSGKTEVDIVRSTTYPTVEKEDIFALQDQAQELAQNPITFKSGEFSYEVPSEEFSLWIGSYINDNDIPTITLQTPHAENELTIIASPLISNPLEPVFEMTNNKVTNFSPGASGVSVDLATTLDTLLANVEKGNFESEIVLIQSPPDTSLGTINELGITELIGSGTSYFTGSSWARMKNIEVASKKINGTVIMPGETYSHNAAVGDISQRTGFVEGLIISGGATVPGVGGGVCQTSTTMFRLILNTGFPIVERHPHSYRVHYYEVGGEGFEFGKPGVDAAVYDPVKDFKFTNDTPYALLLLTHYYQNERKLVYELYSTDTGRSSYITEPLVYNITPALPTAYIDNPDEPIGYLKQVDWAAAGASAKFNRIITESDGSISLEVYYTTYKPWSAKFERGTYDPNAEIGETAPTE